jgi:NUMOD3 motif-containing protein/GIY-YIG catalytic domain-containing protein
MLVTWNGFVADDANLPLPRPGCYLLKCLDNEKRYYGISYDLAGRTKNHARSVRPKIGRPTRTSKLINGLRKHGIDRFIVIPIVYSIDGSIDWLPIFEAEMIAEYDTVRNGYNVLEAWRRAGPPGEEFRAIMKAAANTPEALANRAAAARSSWADPETSASRRAAFADPDVRARKSVAAKARTDDRSIAVKAMQTPEAVAKREATKRERGSTSWTPERRAAANARKAARRATKAAEREANRPSVIEKRRKASLARWAKPGAYERQSQAQLARYADPEKRAAFTEAMNRPDVVAKLSTAAKRQFEDPVQLEANRQQGRASWEKLTPEEREARARANKEAQARPEVRARMSAAKKGKAPWNKGKKTGKPAWNSGLKTGPQSAEERARRSAAVIEAHRRDPEIVSRISIAVTESYNRHPELREKRRIVNRIRWALHRARSHPKVTLEDYLS